MNEPQDSYQQDDWADQLVLARIERIEEQITQNNWTVHLHASFSTLAEDQRFQRLLQELTEQRNDILERLATAISISPQRLGRLQGQAWALAYLMSVAKRSPEEVLRAKAELPGLTELLERERSLLHVPGTDLDRHGREAAGDEQE